MQLPAIKICGITNREDARKAAECGAAYLGYIVGHIGSPRSVTADEAKKIVCSIREQYPHIQHVGVFVDRSLDEVRHIASTIALDIIQLHGNESREMCQQLRAAFLVWKAIIIHTRSDIVRSETYRGATNGILYDAGKGSGQKIASDLLSDVPVDILAGGVCPDNIVRLVSRYQPRIVDINSRVESAPGIKNHDLIQACFNALIV